LTIWNEELTQALVSLIEAGASQGQAALRLDLTRNQVVGKLWRMEIQSKVPRNNKGAGGWLGPKRVKRARPIAAPRAPAAPKPKSVRRRHVLPGRLLFNMGFRGGM
jgi:hypothetical protein